MSLLIPPSRPIIQTGLLNAFLAGVFEYKRRALCRRFYFEQELDGGNGRLVIETVVRGYAMLPGDLYGQPLHGGLRPELAIVADRVVELVADCNHFVTADGAPFAQGECTAEEWTQLQQDVDHEREWDFYLKVRDSLPIVTGQQILHHMTVASAWGRFD